LIYSLSNNLPEVRDLIFLMYEERMNCIEKLLNHLRR
jgi:hypothetical protein